MKARRFAVVGDPIGHSKSPVMQGAALRALGLPHTYEAVRATADELPGVVARLRERRLRRPQRDRAAQGARAVPGRRARRERSRRRRREHARPRRGRPHRRAQHRRPRARRGARAPRPGRARGPRTRCALVLGSGGAARAAVAALGAHLGVRDIVVRARAFADPARRDAFVADGAMPGDAGAVGGLGRGRGAHDRARAGDQRRDARRRAAATRSPSVVAWDALATGAVAIDVVYAPRDTPWLERAARRGLPVRRRPRDARAPGGAGARAVARGRAA